MSCKENDILTTSIVLDDSSRQRITQLSAEMKALWEVPKSPDIENLIEIKREEIEMITLSSILQWDASSATKIALLDRYRGVFNRNWVDVWWRIEFLRRIENGWADIDSKIARDILQFDAGLNRDDFVKNARTYLSNTLTYDFVHTPSSVKTLYKKLWLEWAKTSEEMNGQIRKTFWEMSQEEIDKLLRWNDLYKNLWLSDELIAYTSALTSDKKWMIDAFSALSSKKITTSPEEILKIIRSSTSLEDLKSNLMISMGSIPKWVEERLADEVLSKVDDARSKWASGKVKFLSKLVEERVNKTDYDTELTDYIPALAADEEMSLYEKLKTVNGLVEQWRAESTIIWWEEFDFWNKVLAWIPVITDDSIEKIIWAKSKDELKKELNDSIRAIKDKIESNAKRARSVLNTKKKTLENELKTATWDELDRIHLQIDNINQKISSLSYVKDSEIAWINKIIASLGRVSWIANNRFNTITTEAWDWWASILSKTTRSYWGNKESIKASDVALFVPEKSYQWKDALVWELYDKAYQINSIGVWKGWGIYSSYDELIKDIDSWKIKWVLFPSVDYRNTKLWKEILSARTNKNFEVLEPNFPWYGFFLRDWELRIWSNNSRTMRLIQENLTDENVRWILEQREIRGVDVANKIMKEKYWADKKDVEDITKDLWIEWPYSANDIESAWKATARVNWWYYQSFVDVDEMKAIYAQDIDSRLTEALTNYNEVNKIWKSKEEIDEIVSSYNWDKVQLYANAMFWKKFHEAQRWENELISLISWSAPVWWADEYDTHLRALQAIRTKYNIPYKKKYDFEGIAAWWRMWEWPAIAFNYANGFPKDYDPTEIFRKAYYEAKNNLLKNWSVSTSDVSWRGQFLVNNKLDTYKYPVPSDFVEADTDGLISATKKIKDKVSYNLSKYKEDVIKAVEDTGAISQRRANSLKQKLIWSIRSLEFWYPDLWERKTFVFWVPSITESGSIPQFLKDIDNLAYKYEVELDGLSDLLLRAKGWLKNWEKPEAAFAEMWKVPVGDKWDVMAVDIADAIGSEIERLPEWLGAIRWISKEDIGKLSNRDKAEVFSTIKKLTSTTYNTQWVYETIARQKDPWLAAEIELYKNIPVSVAWREVQLPWYLASRNSSEVISDWAIVKLDDIADLELKERILEGITNSESKDLMTIRWIIADKITVPTSDAWIFGSIVDDMIDSYLSDFAFYSKLFSVPEDIFKKAKEVFKKNALNNKELERTNWIVFTDSLGRDGRLVTEENESAYKMPDIFYSNPKIDVEGYVWKKLTDEEKVDIRNGIERALDMQEHNLTSYKSIENNISSAFNTQALDIMKKQGKHNRLKILSDKIYSTLQMWKNAAHFIYGSSIVGNADSFTSRRARGTISLKNTTKYMLLKEQIIDPKYTYDMANYYSDFMKMTPEEFKKHWWEWLANMANKTDAEKWAYAIAQYYRLLKESMSNLTSSSQFNQEVMDSYDNMFDGIVTLGNNWLYEYWKNWEQRIRWIHTALTNWNVLHGVKAFEDNWMFYKVKSNLFYDTYWPEEWTTTFNKLFNTKLNDYEYRTMMWALTWDVVDESKNPLLRGLWYVWKFLTSPFMRIRNAFPWTFTSWLATWIWYWKAIQNFAKYNSPFEMKWVEWFMDSMWVLTQVWWDTKQLLDNFTNKSARERLNPVAWLYQDMPNFLTAPQWALETAGSFWDNMQNITDAVFARTLKNHAFVNAVISEWFTSIDELNAFIHNSWIPLDYRKAKREAILWKTNQIHEWMINYVGSSLTKNMDNGSSMSKLNSFMNAVISPINFRGTLGTNALIKSAKNLEKLVKVWRRYKKQPAELVSQISKDPVLKNWIMSRLRDIAFSMQTANLDNEGESASETKTDITDFFTMLRSVSQNLAIINTAWPMRIINAMIDNQDYAASAALSQYARNMFRWMLTASSMAEWAAIYYRYWEEWFAAWLSNNYEKWSSGSLRFWWGFIPWVVTPRSTWIDTIVGWDNEYIKMYYGKNLAVLDNKIKKALDSGSFTSADSWDMFKTLMASNGLRRAWDTIVKIDEDEEGRNAPTPNDYNPAVDAFVSDEISKTFWATGKWAPLPLTVPAELWISQDEYNQRLDKIDKKALGDLKVDIAPWSSDQADLIRAVLAWKESFTKKSSTGEEYEKKDEENMMKVYQMLKEDWLLEGILNEIVTTNDKSKSSKSIANYLITYIDSLWERWRDLPVDWLKLKIANANIYDDYIRNVENQWAYANKRDSWKKWQVNEQVLREAKHAFVSQFHPKIQEAYMDKTEDWKPFSNLWLEMAMYTYAVGKWNDIEWSFFYIDPKTQDVTWVKKWVQKIFKKYLSFQRWLESWRSIPELTEEIYWVYWFDPVYSNDVVDKAQTANLAVYMNKKAIELWIPEDRRIEMLAKNMSFISDKWLDPKDVRATLWDDFADEYLLHIYSWIKDATKYARDIIETEWWTKPKWKPKSLSFALNLSKFKDYVNQHASEVYKPINIRASNISPYSLVPESISQRRNKIVEAPVYNAKSKALFAKAKAIKSSIPTKSLKTKALSAKVLKWLKA